MNEKIEIMTFFCEGPHDVSFIYRMLKALGYSSYDSCKIGDFPKPFDSLIKTEAEKSNVESLNLAELRKGFLPAKTMKKDGKFIFLYSLGGDNKKPPRQKMLTDLVNFIPLENEIRTLPENTSLSVVYLFDADESGVLSRLGTRKK